MLNQNKRKYQNFFGDHKVGKNTKIGEFVEIQGHIGDNCKIQAFVFIPEGIEIEDNVFIGPGVVFANDKYPPSNGKHWMKTLVKKGAAIGANATILPGITIGEGAMIGAGAVITKNVPANETWVGNPGHKI